MTSPLIADGCHRDAAHPSMSIPASRAVHLSTIRAAERFDISNSSGVKILPTVVFLFQSMPFALCVVGQPGGLGTI